MKKLNPSGNALESPLKIRENIIILQIWRGKTMEQKKKLKWMVVLEGGQQFLTKFLNKKKLGDFPDTKNYPMEINENAKINP